MDAPHSFSSAYAGSVGSIFGETVTVSFFGDGDRAWCRVVLNSSSSAHLSEKERAKEKGYRDFA